MTIAVVRQMGGIGDVLMLSPVARGLRERHPGAKLRCVTSAGYMNGALTLLAEHNPLWDEIVDVPPQRFTTSRTRELQPVCADAAPLDLHPAARTADRVIDLNNACWDWELAEIAAHGRVVTHRTDIWCEAAGVEPSSKRPVYAVTPAERVYAQTLARKMGWLDGDEPLVFVAMSSHAEARSLHPNHTLRLMDALADAGMRPVAMGLSYAMPLRHAQAPLTSLAHTFPLLELGDAFVGVDSGLLHVAGTVGLPIVGLFGSTDAAMRLAYYPRVASVSVDLSCRPCWYAHGCEAAGVSKFACLTGISTESVVAAVRGILEP